MRRPSIPPRYPTAAAHHRLAELLRLPEPPGGQDWEIELADPGRVGEFLDVYDTAELDDDERFTLMELIVASYDDLLEFGGGDRSLHWPRVRDHLLRRFELHGHTVQYWALPDENDPENFFTFTPRAREVMATVFGPRQRWPRRPVVVKWYVEAPESQTTPGVSLNVMNISDNRDGTGYALWWCRFGDRADGERGFPSVAEAVAYAQREFGVSAGRWRDV